MTVKIICCARCYAKLSRYSPGRTVTQTRVWSYGADYGEFGDMYHQAYVKDLPLERVQSDVLIAYELNGAQLPAEHGFPARLVVPCFYGTNSVKWLTRIKVAKNTGDRGLYHALVQRSSTKPRRRGLRWENGPCLVCRSRIYHRVSSARTSTQGATRRKRLGMGMGRSWNQPCRRQRRREEWAWQRFVLSWHPTDLGAVLPCSKASSDR
jgi:DMSO/TMAO reductase YedYZ molybdopterin-dependent catalytic subunit